MITGFNTDVKHGAKVYHVQTEDKGRNNPKIESLVYVGGEILDNYRTTYDNETAELTEEQIMERLENQHKRVIRSIKLGKYDEAAGFPDDVVTERPLEEVISEYLESEPAEDCLKLVTNGVAGLSKGGRSVLSFQAKRALSLVPVSGVQVRVKLKCPPAKVRVLFRGETDKTGSLTSELDLSKSPPGEYSLVIQAISEWGTSEQEFPLRNIG